MNYSYHVYAYRRALDMQGTAFFLRYNSRIFLLSALHNFSGVDPDTRKLIKGLSGNPVIVWIWQSFSDRPNWTKVYRLYSHNNPIFIGAAKDTEGDDYDLGAYPINDSVPAPEYILDYDENWTSDIIHTGDTVFYCSFPLKGYEQSKTPKMFIGKIIKTPSYNNAYMTSDVFSRPGSSGSAVFKLSGHKVFLIGVISRGNADKNIVYITPFKEAFALLKL